MNECEGSRTSSTIVPPSPTDDELSEYFTETAKDKTCKPVIPSLLAPHSNQFAHSPDHLPPPLQVFFNEKHLELY